MACNQRFVRLAICESISGSMSLKSRVKSATQSSASSNQPVLSPSVRFTLRVNQVSQSATQSLSVPIPSFAPSVLPQCAHPSLRFKLRTGPDWGCVLRFASQTLRLRLRFSEKPRPRDLNCDCDSSFCELIAILCDLIKMLRVAKAIRKA